MDKIIGAWQGFAYRKGESDEMHFTGMPQKYGMHSFLPDGDGYWTSTPGVKKIKITPFRWMSLGDNTYSVAYERGKHWLDVTYMPETDILATKRCFDPGKGLIRYCYRVGNDPFADTSHFTIYESCLDSFLSFYGSNIDVTEHVASMNALELKEFLAGIYFFVQHLIAKDFGDDSPIFRMCYESSCLMFLFLTLPEDRFAESLTAIADRVNVICCLAKLEFGLFQWKKKYPYSDIIVFLGEMFDSDGKPRSYLLLAANR